MTASRPGCPLRLDGVELVLHGPHDRRIGNGAIVERCTVDDGDGEEQALRLDYSKQFGVLGTHVILRRVQIRYANGLAEPALEFRADDRGDLLRRPGGASTAAEARRVGGHVEDLDSHPWLSHQESPSLGVLGRGYRPAGAHSNTDAAPRAELVANGVPVGTGIGTAGEGDDRTLRAHTARRTARGRVARRRVDTHHTHGRRSSFHISADMGRRTRVLDAAEYTLWGIRRASRVAAAERRRQPGRLGP